MELVKRVGCASVLDKFYPITGPGLFIPGSEINVPKFTRHKRHTFYISEEDPGIRDDYSGQSKKRPVTPSRRLRSP